MPPHCDALDGPVVKAARRALEAGDVSLVLPYVHADGEGEVKLAFERALPFAHDSGAPKELAELHFFETVVRVHRAGEGAPYTGLKPAGLDVGIVIPAAERAIDSGSPEELAALLSSTVREEVERRLHNVVELRPAADRSVEDGRRYVQAMLGLQVWANSVHQAIRAGPHGQHTAHAD
jgi:hypothetical protein